MAEEIMTSKEGSFARFTIINRVPAILDDLMAGNRFPGDLEKRLGELRRSLSGGKLSPLGADYPFAGDINGALENNPSYRWLDAPFLFIENYLYHRISEACGFFSNRFDYFLYKKEGETRKGLDRFSRYLGESGDLDSFSEICLINLMGNRADLSQNASYYSSDSASELLTDHRDRASEKIEECSRVDLVLDNGGEELFLDLLLARWLLRRTGVTRVKLHFKSMPYFVSDALISDYRLLLDMLREKKDTARFAGELDSLEEQGKLELGEDPFFVSGKPYSRIPPELAGEFSRSDLVIFKGDLNYRRLVGDRYWPYEKETASLITGFPADILISRILKSEVAAGLRPEAVPDRERTDWMFSGKYGQIELVQGRASSQ